MLLFIGLACDASSLGYDRDATALGRRESFNARATTMPIVTTVMGTTKSIITVEYVPRAS